MSAAEPRARLAVVTFPGSNDDRDAALALELLGAEAVPVWHADTELPEVGAVVLPGGFSYGDYLRAGALARFAPIMEAVRSFAAAGGLVLGICNGFQVLCEAGLLPGVLRPNHSLRFVCRVALGGPAHGPQSPLSGSYPRIRQGTAWLAEQGVTELFYDPNFDPTITGADVPPETALTAVTEMMAALAPS